MICSLFIYLSVYKLTNHYLFTKKMSFFLYFKKFYDALSKRASANGHVIDIFAGCLDQIGLLEMKSMVNSTGGYMILSDSFTTAIFKQSFQRVFNKDSQGNLLMGFNATLDVQVYIND